ncbi:hypothetical protein FCV25MIE_26051 [Fagus crenata]
MIASNSVVNQVGPLPLNPPPIMPIADSNQNLPYHQSELHLAYAPFAPQQGVTREVNGCRQIQDQVEAALEKEKKSTTSQKEKLYAYGRDKARLTPTSLQCQSADLFIYRCCFINSTKPQTYLIFPNLFFVLQGEQKFDSREYYFAWGHGSGRWYFTTA